MKRIALLLTAVICFASVFMLSGCETSVQLETYVPSTTVPVEQNTAVYDITNAEGVVIDTVTVTISDKELQDSDNFFVQDTAPNTSGGISTDRLEQADNNLPPDINNEASGESGALGRPSDADILASDQYLIVMRIVDNNGNSEIYKIARRGNLTAFFLTFEGNPMGVIIGGKDWFILSESDKTYLRIPESVIKESEDADVFQDMMASNPLDFDRKVVSSENVTEDGRTYVVYTYESGEKEYYYNGYLIKSVSPNGTMYFDQINAVVDANVFLPPAGYEEISLSEFEDGDLSELLPSEAAVQ